MTSEELERLVTDVDTMKSTFEQMIQFATELMTIMGDQFDRMITEFKRLEDRVSLLEEAR